MDFLKTLGSLDLFSAHLSFKLNVLSLYQLFVVRVVNEAVDAKESPLCFEEDVVVILDQLLVVSKNDVD